MNRPLRRHVKGRARGDCRGEGTWATAAAADRGEEETRGKQEHGGWRLPKGKVTATATATAAAHLIFLDYVHLIYEYGINQNNYPSRGA
jgi:hypothetical protein